MLFGTFSITLQSCSEALVPHSGRQPYTSTYIPAGSNNPLLYYGDFHNAALDYYVANYSLLETNTRAIEDSLYNFIGDSIDFVAPSWDRFADSILAKVEELSMEQLIEAGFALGEFSQVERNYLLEIRGAFDSLGTHTDSATFINRLNQIENDILANAVDTNQDTPLATIALMKGSFYYWNYHENLGGGSPWSSVLDKMSTKGHPRVQLSETSKAIISSDVDGFLGGLAFLAIRATVIVIASLGTAAIPATVDVLLEAGAAGAISSCITAIKRG
jgi:hypothetical protein